MREVFWIFSQIFVATVCVTLCSESHIFKYANSSGFRLTNEGSTINIPFYTYYSDTPNLYNLNPNIETISVHEKLHPP